jgi:tyrosyl-tRNA synthetase
LTYQQIDENSERIRKQLDAFIGFDGKTAFTANNKDWLADLNYIDFLRDIGVHFSVNRMLSFEAYRKRLETGLSFIEFNYQLLQSYDFLQLYDRYGCRLQIGGDDQWGNIVAGIELIRRIRGVETYGLTFPLVTTSDGKKMGKTEKGALFLDPDLTSPYEFFQYFRNVTDADVKRFLLMFTFLPVSECEALGSARDSAINQAKERLAWEVTALIHGKEEADKALQAARALFGKGGIAGEADSVPTHKIPAQRLEAGILAIDLFVESGLCPSKSEARRLIQQGGAFVNEGKVTDLETKLDLSFVQEGILLLRAGKKRYVRVRVE